jgi:hypothetical protein
MAFDRPFDRSSIGSNAYSIGTVIAYSIGCYRPFDRVCSIPPHPYGDGSAALGLEGPRLSPAEGREGSRRAERPRHRHERDNAGNLEVPGVDRSRSATPPSECVDVRADTASITVTSRHNSLPQRLTELLALSFARLCVPCASQHQVRQDETPHKPLQHSERTDQRHVSGHQRDIYGHDLPHSKTSEGNNGACLAQARAKPRMAMVSIGWMAKDRGGVGVGRKSYGRPIFDLSP